MNKSYKWRTIDGNAKYVDSSTGSDIFGDGTRDKPFQSLGRAWRGTTAKPSRIICRGYFSEAMEDGNHTTYIDADYFGAATFNGHDNYTIYGFKHRNMIIKRTSTNFDGFVGVGCAYYGGHVGHANSVDGVAGSPALLEDTTYYFGAAGGNADCNYIVYANGRHNSTYKISLGGVGNNLHNTWYNVDISKRQKRVANGTPTFTYCLFAKFDMFADEKLVFTKCLFTKDTGWYYKGEEIIITGETSEERYQSLLEGMELLDIPAANRPVFNECLFSNQESHEIFNNAEMSDYTLKIGSDGVISNNYQLAKEGHYYGALPPSLNIPILNDSTGVPACWDEKSVSGMVHVVDNTICVDESSQENTGEILSKIIIIDPNKYSLNAIFSDYEAKFRTSHIYLSNQELCDQNKYSAKQILPIGKYGVKGNIAYLNEYFSTGDVIDVITDDTVFYNNIEHENSIVVEINDPNIVDVCYIRTCPVIYTYLGINDELERGATYINFDKENIIYNSLTIVPGESFLCMNSGDKFISTNPDYKIGILFDDTRVPKQEWIPAQLFGEYFVWKKSGVIQVDQDNIPISSGNYLSYQTTANGGFSQQIIKSYMNHRYVQFKFVVRKW